MHHLDKQESNLPYDTVSLERADGWSTSVYSQGDLSCNPIVERFMASQYIV